MKLCFPVQHNEGIESKVHYHFGSTPFFVVVDSETNSVNVIRNDGQRHAHGACNPVKAVNNQKLDAVVAFGISAGALSDFCRRPASFSLSGEIIHHGILRSSSFRYGILVLKEFSD
jgi:predicted Fe-Mo cluster-binding NifX family protein